MRVLSSSSPLKASLTGTGTTRAGPGGGNGHGFRKASGAADATRLASRRRRAKRTSGTGTRCLPRCILILIVLAKSTWGAFATTSCDMSWWPDKDHGKECGNCKVLVDQFKSKYKTCSGYCDTVGRSCVGAWEESGDTCTVKYVMTCSQQLSSSDAICECGAPTSSGSSTRCDTVIPGLPVSTTTIDKNTCNRGVLPASIGALTNLKVLDMSDQKFYGKIPIEIGKLTKLEKLAVDGTGVSGTIPPLGALTNLKVLDMSDQKISGKIPVEIGKLTKLEELSVGKTAVSGTIPPEISTLTALTYMSVMGWDFSGRAQGGGMISGTLPPEIGKLVALRTLAAHLLDKLSGTIPSEIGLLSSATFITLMVSRKVSGTLPPSIAGLQKLQVFSLASTKISGTVPDITHLQDLKQFIAYGSALIYGAAKSCPAGSSTTFEGSIAGCAMRYSGGTFVQDCSLIICFACPVGKYRPSGSGVRACRPCSPGSSCTGSNREANGPPCPNGFYCPRPTDKFPVMNGMIAKAIAGGQPVTEGAVLVEPCSPGHSCAGGKDNGPCAPGQYQHLEAQATCWDCPVGRWGNGGATECIACSKGKHGARIRQTTEAAACEPCTKGYYQPEEAQIQCTPCPRGTYNDQTQRTLLSECKNCTANTFSSSLGLSSQAFCNRCPIGKHGSPAATGKADEDSACSDCTGGRYQAEEGKPTCQPCDVGRTTPADGSSICTQCGAGYYQGELGKSTCTKCDPGRHASPGKSECRDCRPGRVGIPTRHYCAACEPGKFSDLHRAASKANCTACPKGTYSSAEAVKAKSHCNECPTGHYGDQEGQLSISSCKGCPVGRVGNTSGAQAATECPLCNDGKGYTDETGQVACKPSFCLAGTYGDATQGPDAHIGKPKCTACPIGRFSSAVGLSEASQCTPCPAGQWGDTLGATNISMCYPCPAGKQGSDSGGSISGSSCEACAAGYYSLDGAVTCSPCPERTFGAAGEESSALCSGNCSAGWYCPQATMAPKPCVPYTFAADVVTKETTCSACPANAHCAGGSSVVNRPGFFPLFDGPDTLTRCAQNDNYDCYKPCLSAEACPGAESMDDDHVLAHATNATNETVTLALMRDPDEWLKFYTMSPRGFRWASGRCGVGYEGVLCAKCTSVNSSWRFVRSGSKCRQCPSRGVAWVATALSTTLLALVAAFLINRTVNKTGLSARNRASAHDGRSLAAGLRTQTAAATERRDLFLPLLRQLLSYCMLLGKIGSFEVGAVKAFRLASRAVSEATTGIGLGSYWVTCAVDWTFYDRLVVVAVLPAGVAVVSFVAVRLVLFRLHCRTFMRATVVRCDGAYCNEGGGRARGGEEGTNDDDDDDGRQGDERARLLRARCYMDASVVYLSYLAFPTVVEQIFRALACTDIPFVNGTKQSFLTTDFHVSCVDPWYEAARWLAIVLVATHVVLPPVLLAIWILRNRSELHLGMAIRRVGFLYRGFRLDRYPWWCVVQLVTKVLIAAIVVFLDQELKQMVAATVLFATLLLLQIALRPFEGVVLNKLQAFALLSLTVTQFAPIAVSSYFVANHQDRLQVINDEVAVTISISLLALNGLVVIFYVAAAWQARGEAVKAIQKVGSKASLLAKRLRKKFSSSSSGGGAKRGSSSGSSHAARGHRHRSSMSGRGDQASRRSSDIELVDETKHTAACESSGDGSESRSSRLQRLLFPKEAAAYCEAGAEGTNTKGMSSVALPTSVAGAWATISVGAGKEEEEEEKA